MYLSFSKRKKKTPFNSPFLVVVWFDCIFEMVALLEPYCCCLRYVGTVFFSSSTVSPPTLFFCTSHLFWKNYYFVRQFGSLAKGYFMSASIFSESGKIRAHCALSLHFIFIFFLFVYSLSCPVPYISDSEGNVIGIWSPRIHVKPINCFTRMRKIDEFFAWLNELRKNRFHCRLQNVCVDFYFRFFFSFFMNVCVCDLSGYAGFVVVLYSTVAQIHTQHGYPKWNIWKKKNHCKWKDREWGDQLW